MSELPDPRFLDDRLAHWAETKPDGRGVDLPRPHLDVGAVERPGPPAGRRAEGARHRPRRRGRIPRQEPPGLRRADDGRCVARRGQRDHQLPAGRRRGGLRAQRLRRQGADRRHRAEADDRQDPRQAAQRRAHHRGHPRRRRRRRVRGDAGRGDPGRTAATTSNPTTSASSCTPRAPPAAPRASR